MKEGCNTRINPGASKTSVRTCAKFYQSSESSKVYLDALTSTLPKGSLRNNLAKITVNIGLADMIIF